MGLANWLTFGRIAAIPVLLALFFVKGPDGEALRLSVFLAAAVTDWLDGWVARRRGRPRASARRWIRPRTRCWCSALF